MSDRDHRLEGGTAAIAGARAPNGRDRTATYRLFELPDAFTVPSEHREIERLIAVGQHAEAAQAIGELRMTAHLEPSRTAMTQAICWMRAGRPDQAAEVLGSCRRTIAGAWCLAWSLVQLDRLEEAADQVVWIGDRIPLVGDERMAARALLGRLGRSLPLWLIDPERPSSHQMTPAGELPPPYLASFFYPSHPEVPPGFGEVIEAVQRGAYKEAAWALIGSPAVAPRLRRRIAVAIAECWLLAEMPAAAEAWLQHRLPANGVWAQACAHVQQCRFAAALEPLSWLAANGGLGQDRRGAAAALMAHLKKTALPPGLSQLDGHPFLDLSRAKEAGYRLFTEKIAREIERQKGADQVESLIRRVEASCATLPADEARSVLVPIYEAAVRASSNEVLAEHGLRLLRSQPDLLGCDEIEYSRALLFATACGQLDALQGELRTQAAKHQHQQAQFAGWLTAARLSLVRYDITGLAEDNGHAAAVASVEDKERVVRLRRVARWLSPGDAPRLSEWALREVHHLLPLEVAECLEDREDRLRTLRQDPELTPRGRRAVEAAARHLQDAVSIRRGHNGTHPGLNRALGRWALNAGVAMFEWSVATPADAVPYTAAAWCLLGQPAPDAVMAAHAGAVGRACTNLESQDQVRHSLAPVLAAIPAPPERRAAFTRLVLDAWSDGRRAGHGVPGHLATTDFGWLLRPASPGPPLPSETTVAAILASLEGIPDEARPAVEQCVADGLALLPEMPPFRGRRWFDSDTAHRRYQQAREETDARAAQKAFEEAWTLEPGNHVTIQGLILGLARRLRDKPSRIHLLDYVARRMDHTIEREVEAALAYTRLARLARHEGERRFCLERAANALQRRTRREQWRRARNGEIALRLELGHMVAAGESAWEESCVHLPGSEASTQYAQLAATLWTQARDSERALEGRIGEALQRARSPRLTNHQAVRYAVATGRLVALDDVRLDDDALEDLWRACRGQEDELCRFLERGGGRGADAEPRYLAFLAMKLEAMGQVAEAARIRNQLQGPAAVADPPRLEWLRLATAELIDKDPLAAATPRGRLAPPPVREFLASLRSCASGDDVAYAEFGKDVRSALAALFDLREASPAAGRDSQWERLTEATRAVRTVGHTAKRFSAPAVALMAGVLWRYLALALDRPAVHSYELEKLKRLAPSSLGNRLGDWWVSLCRTTPSLDFFHQHHAYRCPDEIPVDRWLKSHRVYGEPVRDAVRHLAESLDSHTRWLDEIEQHYMVTRTRRDLGTSGFGLSSELQACCDVLRSALAVTATPEQVRAIPAALERLGWSLRRIDLARMVDHDGILCDKAIPAGRYLLPRAAELFGHWRRNVPGGDACLQTIFELRDESGDDVLCLMCLDDGIRPAPDSIPLRGLASFAELVEALGGQLHLWFARPGGGSRCLRQHGDRVACRGDEDTVRRIEDRLRHLTANRWHSHRAETQHWLRILDSALRMKGSATLAFALLPQLHQSEAR